jgi:hypothetical protein
MKLFNLLLGFLFAAIPQGLFGQIVPCDTVFKDPGGDGNYAPFTFLLQEVEVSNSSRITLDFTLLDLALGDTLKIYDNQFINQPILAVFTQGDLPNQVQAFSNKIRIVFTSNEVEEAQGYQFTIKCFSAYFFNIETFEDSLCASGTLSLLGNSDYPNLEQVSLVFGNINGIIDTVSINLLNDTTVVQIPENLSTGLYSVYFQPNDSIWFPLRDSATLFIHPPTEIPTIFGDSTFCAAPTWMQSSIDGNLQWFVNDTLAPGAQSSFFEVTEPGVYQLQNSGVCGVVLSSPFTLLQLEFPPTPLLTPIGLQQLCIGTELSASLVAETDSITWIFEGTALNQQSENLQLSAVGAYVIESINQCGSSFSDTLWIENLFPPAPPEIQADGPIAFCQGNNVEFSIVQQFETTVAWFENNQPLNLSGNSITVDEAGVYTVELTNNCGTASSVNSQTVVIQENPPIPFITPAGPTELCEGNTVVLAVYLPANASFSWYQNGQSLNNSNDILQVTETGSYTAIAENNCGTAAAINSIPVVINPLPEIPLLFAQGNPFLCNGSSVLVATTPQSGVTWQWKRNGNIITSSTNSVFVSQPGVYTLSVSNGCGVATSSNQIDVSSGAAPILPNIQVTGATSFCEGLSVTLTTTPQNGVLIEWLRNGLPSGLTGYQVQATEAGVYTVRVSNACDTLLSTQFTNVVVFPLPPVETIAYSGSLNLCEGDSLTLSVNPLSNVSYQWKRNGVVFGPNSPEVTVYEEGFYQISLANSCGSTLSSNSLYLNVDSLQPSQPEIIAQPSPALCPGGFVLLNAPPIDFQEYTWYLDGNLLDGFNGAVLQATVWGTYSVQSGNACGISGVSGGVTLGPGDPPPPFDLYSEGDLTEFCSNDSLFITAQVPFGVSVRWFLNGDSLIEGPSQIAARLPGIYTANAWNGCGEALANDTLILTTIPAPEIPVITENNGVLSCSADGSLAWLDSSLQPILGATSTNYQPVPINATYFVRVTAENGCSEISAQYNYIIDGIHEALNAFKMSPNPASEILLIESDKLGNELSIFNVMGQTVWSRNTKNQTGKLLIDVSEIPVGLYFVRLGSAVKPLVIQ